MKKNKAVALVLAASTSATLVMAKNAIIAHADTLNHSNTNVKNMKTYTNKGQVVNVTSDLKVRQGASTDTQVLGYLQPGSIFNIASKEGKWYKVQYNNQYGYVYGEYVKELNGNNKDKIELGSNEGKVVNVETNLRFRSEPSLNSNVIGYFANGQVVKVIGETNGWYKISYQGQVGYADGQYIQGANGKKMIVVNEPTDTSVKDITTGKVTHVQTDLRIRERATTQSSIIGRLHEGNVVNIIGKDGDWYKINVNGKIGFVCADYINVFNENNLALNNNVANTQVVNRITKSSSNQLDGTQSVSNTRNNVKTLDVKNVTNATKVNNDSNKIENQYKVDISPAKVQNNKTIINTPQVKIETTSVKNVVNNFNGYGKVINAASGLRIRNSASTNSSIIGFLYNGNAVKITGKEGNWYKIDSNGTVGYVYNSYIQLTNGQAINTSESSSNSNTTKNNTTKNNSNTLVSESGFGEVVNVSSNLIIRSGASTNSSILGSLNDGETFQILGKTGDWYKISKNNQIGYVFSDYVKIVSSSEANHATNNSNSNTANNGNSMQAESAVGQVINIDSNLRVRTAPNTNCSVMGYLLSGQKIKVTGRQGNWYRINLDGSTGYVYSSYIKIVNGNPNDIHNEVEDTHNNNSGQITYSNKYGQVINIESSLRIRSGSSLNSSVIGYLLNGQGVKVLARVGDWYKIDNNGQIGYTSANYIKLSDHMINNNTNTSNNNTSNNNAVNNNTASNTNNSASYERLYTLLKDQIGSPYLWGAEGQYVTNSSLQQLQNEFPTAAAEGRYNIPSQYINHGYRGFDCSGLVDWAFSQLGISVGRTTYQQVNAGRAVSLNDVRPGDLLFFKGAVHVGVYIGNGKWIVAPHSHTYVTIQNVPWSLIGCARRVLN